MKFLLQHRIWVTVIVLTVVGLSIYVGVSYLFGPTQSRLINFGIESAASVERVEPLPNTTKIGPVPDFVVYLDLKVKADKASLKSQPELSFEKSNLKEDRLLFRPKKALKPSTEYTLTVLVEGKERFSWKVSTKAFSVADDYAEKVNAAKKAIPYKGENFRLAYDPPTDKYYADISGEPMTKYLEEVKTWFSTFGVTDTTPLNIIAFPVRKFN